jgi:hypothetical protein
VIGGNREKRNITSPLDCLCYFSLMRSTVAGDTARNDLATLSDKESECTWLLVVDSQIFFRTKTAHLSALKRASFTWATGATGTAGTTGRALSRAASRTLI